MGSTNDRSTAGTRCNRLMMAWKALMCTASLLGTLPAMAIADSAQFNIAAQPLPTALKAFAAQAHMQLLYQYNAVESVKANPIRGDLDKHAALDQLLHNTGLEAIYSSDNAATIRPINTSVSSGNAQGGQAAQGSAVSPEEGKNNSSGGFRVAQVGQGQTSSDVSLARQSDQNSQQNATGLSEIIVTATRRSERLQDVPMSITALSGEELAKRGAGDVNDIVANTPGLYNTAQGLGSQNNLVIRGVTTGTGVTLAQGTVSFLLDDMDLNPGASTFTTANPRIVDVQQVEVLRGPQGTLFGAGSLSGAVRFVTNKPDLENFSGSVEVTGSSTDDGNDSRDISGVLNAPIIEGKLGARIVAYSYDDGGWVDNSTRNLSNVNGTHTDGVRLSLDAKPADQVSLLFTAINDRDHELGSSATFYYPQPGLAGYQYQQPRYDLQSSLTDTHIYNLLATWQPTWGTLTSATNYYDRPSTLFEDLGAILPVLGLAPASANPAAPTATFNTIHDVSQEFRLESPQMGAWRFITGAFYQRIASDPNEIVNTTVPGVPILLSEVDTAVQWQAAVFGSMTYTFADRLDFTLGARVSRDVVHFSTAESGLLAGAATVGSEVDNPVTPRAAITFRQTSDLTWYLQAAKGYRVGGPNITAGNNATLSSYKPDSLWNYEVGNKVRLLDGTLNLNTSLYDIEWSDMQIELITPQGFNYIGNGGKARIYGLEEEATLRPIQWLEVGGTVSADHAATTSSASISRVSYGDYGPAPDFEPTAATQNGVVAGERLPASPELQASLYGQVEFHVLEHEAYIRVSGQYIGAAYTDFDSQGLRFGGFSTGDVRAGVKWQHFEVIGFVDNFTNSDGAVSASDSSSFFVPTAYRVRPRTAGLTLRANF
jgi:iron complex outermembrane receptor protein